MGKDIEIITKTTYTCDKCGKQESKPGKLQRLAPEYWLQYQAVVAQNVPYREYILCSFTCLVDLHMSVPSHLHALGRLLKMRKYVMVEGLLPLDEREGSA